MPKFLHNIDLAGNELQNAVMHVSGSEPTAVKGKLYYDSNSDQLQVYNGSAWLGLTTETKDTLTLFNFT